MKILMVFVDMLRAFSQHVCNDGVPWNKLDDVLASFGGIVYSNCYSPSPDTPRGLASIWTGTYPKWNGCDERIKYPKFFLDDAMDNLWKLFLRTAEDCSFNLFLQKKSVNFHSLPKGVEEHAILFDDDDLLSFLDSVRIEENSVTYINLNDYHTGIDKVRAATDKMGVVYDMVAEKLKAIFDKHPRDTFDIGLIFSDHGCSLDRDGGILSHRGRIQTYLQLWVKNAGIDELHRNNKMCSCMDIFPTIAFLLKGMVLNRIDGINLLSNAYHPYLVIEDYSVFTTEMKQILGWWGVLFPQKHIFTDIYDRWYSTANATLSPREIELCKKILENYASQYPHNIKKQKMIEFMGWASAQK